MKLFYEEVTEKIGDVILASKLREATNEDIVNSLHLHRKGKCPHTVVKDEKDWMYDVRSCAICGKGLGTV